MPATAVAITALPAAAKPAPAAHGSYTYEGTSLTAVTNPTADEPTTTISPGATVTADVNTDGDVDLFNISLVAGQTYSFSLAGSGSSPLIDPILTLTQNGQQVAMDDDGGIGINSLLTFTATTTGTYQVSAAAYPESGLTGEYTLAVRQMAQDSVTSVPQSATPIAVDSLTHGFIETTSDTDMYAVTLVEGIFYTFNVAGGTDYNTPEGSPPFGELDTSMVLYDASGNFVASNHDLSPEDRNSALNFVPSQSGTYFVRVDGGNNTGGYTLEVEGTDLSTVDPLDSIDWGTQLSSNTVTVYFATAGQTFDGITSEGWTAYEIEQAMEALQTYADVSGLNISRTTTASGATFRLVTTTSDEYLGYFNPPGETNAGVGAFATNGAGWNTTGGLEPGGTAFATLVHEFGHGLGLAHPHDNGGGSPVMVGVYSSFGSYVGTYGAFDLNQGVYTTMSYNDGWMMHPNGTSSFSLNYGYQAGPSALDIAVIQENYGASTSNTGNTVYVLPTANVAGTFWDVIWDTGGTDTIVHNGVVSSRIDLTAATLDYSATGGGVVSYSEGIFGGFTIAAGVIIENATGGTGNDLIIGNAASNVLIPRGGLDMIFGGGGADTIRGTAAELSGDFIADFTSGDRLVITDATLASFTFSLEGHTLTYSGGSLGFTDGVTGGLIGQLVASAAPEGGVQLTLSNAPPPPPAVTRARLILTEGGQDLSIGGNVAVFGTSAGGEVIEIVRGNVTLDASFNAGGDTVVLPGNAGSYTAALSGSFVTISGGGISVSIPVGTAGMAVQFANSTRPLEIEGGQVVLGAQQITSTAQPVADSGAPLVDAAETGPDSFARVILTAPGQDVDVGGNANIFGTSGSGEVITVLGGEVRLDASFNAGGDTVMLPGATDDYATSLSGSLVTITDGEMSVAIPVGVNGLTVDFSDADPELRIEGGQVMLGDDVVAAGGAKLQGPAFAMSLQWGPAAHFSETVELHRIEFSESGSFA